MGFHYVYILSLNNGQFYIGRTKNLIRRLKEHKSGQERTTSKYLPCALETYLAFKDSRLAVKFEKYLKTGSGLAFRKRHLV
jgi:putative endonuclease